MSDPDSAPHAVVEQRGHILIVTLNRPQTRNALSGEMLSIMVEAWDRVDNDPDIRVILTGAGGYFCAGMDPKAATKKPPGDSVQGRQLRPVTHRRSAEGASITKPLIAAVEGPAIAGHRNPAGDRHPRRGRKREVRHLEAKWSLYPMGGSAVRLVRQIPYTVACDLLLTGGTSRPPRRWNTG